MTQWNHSVDVLVMGAGAAGLTAAWRAADLGLDVLIVEKGPVWGGSVSMSAGFAWIPGNASCREQGGSDTEDDGVEYLTHLTDGTIAEDRIRTFIHEGNRMIEELGQRSHVQFKATMTYPDYHAEDPGGRAGGRSLEPIPVDGTLLGDEFHTLHQTYPSLLIFGKMMMTVKMTRGMLQKGLGPKLPALRRALRYVFVDRRKRKRSGRDPFLTWGQALATRLRLSLIDQNVPLWLSSPIASLVTENGRVTGAVVERDGQTVRVEGRKGVIIAAGGFERNDEMRQKYQRHPIKASWTVANEYNTGDGILVAEGIGAKLDTELMREAWWLPGTPMPEMDSPCLFVLEKSMPHSIFVDRRGRRFVNEAKSYSDVVIDMYELNASNDATIPAWFVFDGAYRAKYNIGAMLPKPIMSDKKLRPSWQPGAGWLHKAETIEELAAEIGVDPEALRATVERFNGFALTGVDEDFHRGESANDLHYSDPRVKPNPSLGSIAKAPFYAVPVQPSDLGTKSGLITDLGGRVLDTKDQPIPGLYAAGNSTWSITGTRYPGAGATIGPAMTFGYLAAEGCARDGGVTVS